jgi:hypothetical protein
MNMLVILISGKAESGKTTAANYLKEAFDLCGYKVAKMAYGDYVKFTAKTIYAWDGKKDEAGRQLLQHWGTEVVRQKQPDFWVDNVIELCELIKDEFDIVIIDDVRFPNEIERWNGRFNYTTLRIERPGHENTLTPEQRKHISETALDGYKHMHTISAENMGELLCKTALYTHQLLAHVLY